jgi:hypothetical protein
MAEGPGIIAVDTIAHDDSALERRVAELAEKDVVVDRSETIGRTFEQVDSSVCAILIKRHGGGGAVRVFGEGDEVKNVVTGPNESTGYVIVLIATAETCRFLGTPTVRYFRYKTS